MTRGSTLTLGLILAAATAFMHTTAAQTPARPAAQPAATGGTVVAITGARVLPASGPALERATVIIRDGRIAAVAADAAVPDGARIIDGTGKVVTPGFIDSSTQVGIVEIGLSADGTNDQRTTDPALGAAFSVLDAFNPHSTVIPVTRVEGVTRVLVLPGGTGHIFGGHGAVMDLGGAHVPESVTRAPAAMLAMLGEAGAGLAGGSRAAAMLRLRETLEDARDFGVNRQAFNAAQRRGYARSRLDLEALQPVLKGEIPLAVHANRASDLLAAMRLAEEFKLRVVLFGAAEGWMVAEEIARRKVPVVLKPLTNLPAFDSLGATLENAARLQAAGVTIAFSTFDTHNVRNLRQEAGNAIAYGLDPAAALAAVTITPARLWGVAERVGSLEAGKDADVVVWSGDPFELLTSAEHVFIKGREIPHDTRQRQLFERYRDLKTMPRR